MIPDISSSTSRIAPPSPLPAPDRINDDARRSPPTTPLLGSHLAAVNCSSENLKRIDKTPLSEVQAATKDTMAHRIGLSEIVTQQGAELRAEAESLLSAAGAPAAPLELKGSFLKRSLITLGILSGAGALGGAGYIYYRGRAGTDGSSGYTAQPETAATSSHRPILEHGQSGRLEDSFGNHIIHHDSADSVRKHNRRHLDDPTPSAVTTPPIRHSKTAAAPVEITFKKINRLLRKNGHIKPGSVTKEQQIAALAKYVFNLEKNLTHPKQIRNIARIILAANNFYGGKKGETISSAQAESIVRQWVFQQILGMSPEEYIAAKLRVDKHSDAYTVASLEAQFHPYEVSKEKLFDINKIPPEQRGYFDLMWYTFLEAEMPVLNFIGRDDISEMKLTSLEFANLYAGVRVLNGMSVKAYTLKEALQTGEKTWLLAATEGITEEQIALFSSPALFTVASDRSRQYTGQNTDRITAINQYLDYRTKLIALHRDIEQKYNSYLSVTKEWLTKGALADKIITQCNANNAPHQSTPHNGSAPVIAQPTTDRAAKQRYLNELHKPCASAPDSLDAEYRRLTEKVADSFREIDKYLVASAINVLPRDELAFISSPHARIHYSAKARPVLAEVPLLFPKYARRDDAMQSVLGNTEFITVTQGNEQRLYALRSASNKGEGYRIHRLDQTVRNVKDWVGGYETTVSAYKAPADWNVEEFTLRDAEELKASGDRTKFLVDTLTQKHRNNLSNSLYASGNDKSDIQKIWEFAKHLIPFYDCVEGIVNHKPSQAVPACLLDALSFIPLFGQASSLSAKFGMSVSKGIIRGMSGAGKITLANIGKNIAREVRLPTTAELTNLGKTALGAVDPGFGLVAGVSKGLAERLINLMAQDATTAELARGLSTAVVVDRLAEQSAVKSILAPLEGADLKIPVKVVEKGTGGENIYVRINPETGEGFGKKLISNKSGKLVPLIAEKSSLPHFRNEVKGIKNWDDFSFDKNLNPRVVLHTSGFYTSVDTLGKPSGHLFLMRDKEAIPITEIYKDKYYMAGEGSNRVIIQKRPDGNGFELSGPATPEKLKSGEYLDSSWCRPLSGRKLLGNDNLLCIGDPQLKDNEVVYRYNVDVPSMFTKGASDFNVRIRGLYGMDMPTRVVVKQHIDDALFFEFGNIRLTQKEIDATKYEQAFADKDIFIKPEERTFTDLADRETVSNPSVLTKNEKIAIRRWTSISDSGNVKYSDGMTNIDELGITELSFDLNEKISANKALNEDERNMVRLLDSALEKIPSQQGEFVRISEYNSASTPWDHEIAVGDLVTNYPCFMSVSSTQEYIRRLERDFKDNTEAVIIYRFEKTHSAKPLLKGSASLTDEQEALFKRNSFFKVKQVTIAEDLFTSKVPSEFRLKKRIVVTLDEVEKNQIMTAKNIHTGEAITL